MHASSVMAAKIYMFSFNLVMSVLAGRFEPGALPRERVRPTESLRRKDPISHGTHIKLIVAFLIHSVCGDRTQTSMPHQFMVDVRSACSALS